MNNKKPDQTEIVSLWVTPETAKLIERAEDPNTKEAILADAAKKVVNSMKEEVEMLDEEVLKQKGLMAMFKKKFREAKEAQLKEMEDIYHNYEKELGQTKTRIGKIVEEIKPLTQEAKNLNEALSSIKQYNLERMLELLEAINRAYTGKSKEMVDKLLGEYKES